MNQPLQTRPVKLLAWRFARRELRSGIAGFRIFLACLALGVAALAAAGSTAQAFRQGLAAQARAILGGDVAASVEGRRFTAQERAAFARLGRTTDTLRIRAMAERAGEDAGADRRLAEVRGVDAAFPLAGTLTLGGAPDLAHAVAPMRGIPGAAVEPALLARLHLRVGETLRLGDAAFVVRASLLGEPDKLGRGFALGPAVIVDRGALERAGLVEADALFGETVRIALPPGASAAAAIARITRETGGGAFRLRGRNDATAGLTRLIDQLEFFLSFIGLASLLAGGLGVSMAVSSYLEARKPSIAVLKALGASGALVRDVFMIQIGALAMVGVAIGLGVGAATPFLVGAIARDRLPLPVAFGLYPQPLINAAAFGMMAAAAFSLGPLARARATPPAALFRRDLTARAGLGVETLGRAAAAAGLVGLTLATAPTPLVAAVMIAGVVAAFFLLRAIGWAAAAAAARGRGFTRGPVRVGLANLAGPASAARTASPSIGLGVALLTSILLIQASLVAEVRDVAPDAAPSLILTQIPPEDGVALDAIVGRSLGVLRPDRYRRAPFATGRIVALHGAPPDLRRIAPGQRWAFDQDLTVSTLDAPPPDADLVAGRWWPAGYAGSPLVVLDGELARGAHLAVGDALTLSILGRTLEVRIAALRTIDFGRFGATFPLILDPAALAGANLREVAIVKASRAQDTAIEAALGRSLPALAVIDVREQLEAAARVFDQLAWAVRGAAAVAGFAGVLVLIGAVAASGQARAREAAVLQVLGASRTQIPAATGVEYGLVGLIAGVAGVALGVAAATPIVVQVFHAPARLDALGLAGLLAAAVILSAGAGLIGAATALARRPAPVLRGE